MFFLLIWVLVLAVLVWVIVKYLLPKLDQPMRTVVVIILILILLVFLWQFFPLPATWRGVKP